MASVVYKGFEIRPSPKKVRNREAWTLEVYICKEHGGHRNEGRFSAANIFPSKKEAVEHCVRYAKLVIDGEAQGATVAHL